MLHAIVLSRIIGRGFWHKSMRQLGVCPGDCGQAARPHSPVAPAPDSAVDSYLCGGTMRSAQRERLGSECFWMHLFGFCAVLPLVDLVEYRGLANACNDSSGVGGVAVECQCGLQLSASLGHRGQQCVHGQRARSGSFVFVCGGVTTLFSAWRWRNVPPFRLLSHAEGCTGPSMICRFFFTRTEGLHNCKSRVGRNAEGLSLCRCARWDSEPAVPLHARPPAAEPSQVALALLDGMGPTALPHEKRIAWMAQELRTARCREGGEGSGVECSAVQCSGVQWSGVEWSGEDGGSEEEEAKRD